MKIWFPLKIVDENPSLILQSSGEYDFSSMPNSYHSPELFPRTANLTATISFLVRVPVLSEQMTVVHPRVSTDYRRLTMQLFAAIFLVPSARHVVITAGKPSGMAATASATAILK